MSSQKNNRQPKHSSSKELASLKKLPSKKAPKTSSKTKSNELVIDIKSRKDYSSTIELFKRKIPNAPQSKMPVDIKPMLTTLVDEPFSDEGWQFELKLDGYRTLAYLNSGKVELRSRNNNSFNKKFQAVYDALSEWNINAVVDGEVVVLNEEGIPDFNGIQLWETHQQGQLVFYVFDLLWIEGIDITSEPLHLRRELLQEVMPDTGVIRFSDHIDEIGVEFFEIAKKNNLEGIIAKKKDSKYTPDFRSKTWLKIKIEEKHEAIICGYTRKRDSDRLFSSLVLGIYENGQIKFIGQTGTGFSAALQKELMKKMNALVVKTYPFKDKPTITDPVVWLKPHLVCEVKYTELTGEGLMRHASFQGLREDKTAKDLNIEEELNTEEILEEVDLDESDLVSKTKTEQLVTIDGHDLKLTNLKKIYWPAITATKSLRSQEAITKGDMLRYYYNVAEYIMPYMKDRPQSLNRFPDGINGESFYHKNMGGKVDKWLKTFRRISDSSNEPKDFLICTNTASLIYMANLGCIEMNPWHSRAQSPHYPDWCVIDLDPGEISFEKVIETAQVVHNVLESLQVPSYPKTSGSTGIHIYIPLGAKYNYEQSKQLAELIANMVHEELPSFTSLVRNPQKRQDKIYIDYLQNRPIQTICSPYSVRPKPGATVSMPLHWDEVKKGLKISDFTLKNSLTRLKREGDLFGGVLGKGIDLNKVLKGLSSLI
jgi:bifunctional non-homologous end joining protein LigD